MRRPLRLALALAALPLLAACHNGSTEPNRTVSYTGSLTKEATAASGILVMNSVGNARATLTSLAQTAADGTPVIPPTFSIAMGIGPDRNPCIPTGSFLLQPERHLSLGLDKGSYCLVFTPSGTLDAGVKLDFEMQVEVTD